MMSTSSITGLPSCFGKSSSPRFQATGQCMRYKSTYFIPRSSSDCWIAGSTSSGWCLLLQSLVVMKRASRGTPLFLTPFPTAFSVPYLLTSVRASNPLPSFWGECGPLTRAQYRYGDIPPWLPLPRRLPARLHPAKFRSQLLESQRQCSAWRLLACLDVAQSIASRSALFSGAYWLQAVLVCSSSTRVNMTQIDRPSSCYIWRGDEVLLFKMIQMKRLSRRRPVSGRRYGHFVTIDLDQGYSSLVWQYSLLTTVEVENRIWISCSRLILPARQTVQDTDESFFIGTMDSKSPATRLSWYCGLVA